MEPIKWFSACSHVAQIAPRFISTRPQNDTKTMIQKAPYDFSASDWYNKIPISLFQKPRTPNSMIWGFADVSRPPTNQNDLSFFV